MHDRIPLIGASARDIEDKARMKSIRGVCRIIHTFDGSPIRRGLPHNLGRDRPGPRSLDDSRLARYGGSLSDRVPAVLDEARRELDHGNSIVFPSPTG